MAIQTRYTGDANGVVNVDSGAGFLGNIVSPGLTKAPIALKILINNATTLTSSELATGGAVETILRAIEIDSTVTMYQVDTDRISVLLEATGAGGANGDTYQGAAPLTTSAIATALQTRLQALPGATLTGNGPTGSTTGGNIGISANVAAQALTVTSSNFKLN
jgi:hypothetical protein